MIVWQVNWRPHDSNHKLFVVSKDRYSSGKSIKSDSMIRLEGALSKTLGTKGYYFYLELIK